MNAYGSFMGNVPFSCLDTGITYEFNNLGHRCLNFSDINQDDYILFTGCSHTAGFGLHLEDTFPYIVSKRLNIDYYNLAVGGTGADIVYHNLAVFFNTFRKKPKYLIIQMPFITRYSRLQGDVPVPEGTWSKGNSARLSYYGDKIGFFDMRLLLFKKYIETLDAPLVTINDNEFNKEFYKDSINFIVLDKALDTIHYGPISHNILATNIINKIK